MANNNKVVVKCSVCGCDIYVTCITARRKSVFKCRKCLAIEAKERYEKLSPEEKKRRAEISKVKMKEHWASMSDTDKKDRMEKLNDGFKEYNSKMTDEERTKMNIILSESQKKRWSNISDEDKERIVKPMHEASKEWYNSLSDEDKKKYHERLQNGNKQWWANISDEEYIRLSQLRSDASKKYWDNVTEEDLKVIGERQSKIIKAFWENMDESLYKEWDAKRAEGLKKYFAELSNRMSINEINLINHLNLNRIKYQARYYNTIKHPEFDKLFPVNPITGSKVISPYHQWDFMIELYDKNIFIDIDGSVHDPKNSTTGITLFNDSKRPYQTDGLDAYIIKCYDDKLTDNTPVVKINTGEIINFKSLIGILTFGSMSDREKRKMIKSVNKSLK